MSRLKVSSATSQKRGGFANHPPSSLMANLAGSNIPPTVSILHYCGAATEANGVLSAVDQMTMCVRGIDDKDIAALPGDEALTHSTISTALPRVRLSELPARTQDPPIARRGGKFGFVALACILASSSSRLIVDVAHRRNPPPRAENAPTFLIEPRKGGLHPMPGRGSRATGHCPVLFPVSQFAS